MPLELRSSAAHLGAGQLDRRVERQRSARIALEQLLRGIRANRAKVVVIDITGVAALDASVANHLVLTVEAARLLGARVIVTGLSPDIANTLVNIGVDLGKMNTVGDLQGGIEEAELLLGYRIVRAGDPVHPMEHETSLGPNNPRASR